MSTLANLQERLHAAFGHHAPADAPAHVEEAETASPAIEPAPVAVETPLPSAISRNRLQHAWLGGGGLVAGAALLIAGYAAGPLALVCVLGIIVVAALAAYFLGRLPAGLDQASPLPAGASMAADTPLKPQPSPTDLLSTVHDAFGDIAVSRTADRRILHANATFRSLTGRARPQGMTCEEIGLAFRPDARPNRYDVEIATPHGQRIFAWQDVMIRDPSSGQMRIESIARDVTDERIASREREQARLKAEHDSDAKSRLLATVSHEIRTPLSGILGMSHLISQSKLTQEQESYLSGIRQSGNALAQLVEDLLDFSTLESGRFQLRPRAESLRHLMESVVEMLAHRAHEKDIEIGATVRSNIPELMSFDPARLRQVLFNVIGNAVKFTQTGGVLVRADLDAGDLVITVSDTGPGMTAEEQARIFNEFEQAGNALEKSAGHGLGLTISARIIQEFGGAMTLSSEKGRGSEFVIRFPVEIPRERRERNRRGTMLKASNVLLLAPHGAAATATAKTIHTLGGTCHLLEVGETGEFILDALIEAGERLTDVIVDSRLAPQFLDQFSARLQAYAPGMRRIFLVNPEQRSAQPLDLFDAWLIRPLREQSLIDVLRGRMKGMERRDAINDNQPGFVTAPPLPASSAALNILLAEDDPVNAMLVRAVLMKAGHGVDVVEDVESLLDRVWNAGKGRPDIVITDLSMPGGDGVDMLARLRIHERRQALAPIPVIVLTADSRDETRRAALLNGASIVLSKPAEPERLINEVNTLAALNTAFARQS